MTAASPIDATPFNPCERMVIYVLSRRPGNDSPDKNNDCDRIVTYYHNGVSFS